MKKSEFVKIDKLHVLLRVAIDDMVAASKSPFVELSMSWWHDKGDERSKVCYMCMAGAVMRETLKVPNKKTYSPNDFDDPIDYRLRAINDLRTGGVDDAAIQMKYAGVGIGNWTEFTRYNRYVHRYEDKEDLEKFLSDLEELYQDLLKADI